MEGMLTPNAASNLDKKDDPLNPMIHHMKVILDKVAKKYCPGCLVGEAYKLLKYESFGTFIDHNLYINNIPVRLIIIHFS